MGEMTYRDAGVDLDAASASTEVLKEIAKQAHGKEVLSGIGAFGGLFLPSFEGYKKPVLVASADGIGTKVMIASALKRFKNLGHDIVNHCINDIGSMGALPLFFLDYLALGTFSSETVTEIVSGIAEACRQSNCSLLGGETAEMPDLYKPGDFDVAGFIVGVVDQGKIVNGSTIEVSNKLIGISSNGLHTNGYSLVRKIFFSDGFHRSSEAITGSADDLGTALLRPHKSYFPLLKALQGMKLNGIAHITGGGITGNLIRILPEGCRAEINWNSWEMLPVFNHIQQHGNLALSEMKRVFNMGIGLVLAVCKEDCDRILAMSTELGFAAFDIGKVTAGEKEVAYVH